MNRFEKITNSICRLALAVKISPNKLRISKGSHSRKIKVSAVKGTIIDEMTKLKIRELKKFAKDQNKLK